MFVALLLAISLLTDAETILLTDLNSELYIIIINDASEIKRGPLKSYKHYFHLFKLG